MGDESRSLIERGEATTGTGLYVRHANGMRGIIIGGWNASTREVTVKWANGATTRNRINDDFEPGQMFRVRQSS